jgi:hypothetical protein
MKQEVNKLEVNKLEDDKTYEASVDIFSFCEKGDTFTGKQIKTNIPFDLSSNQGWKQFFKLIN